VNYATQRNASHEYTLVLSRDGRLDVSLFVATLSMANRNFS